MKKTFFLAEALQVSIIESCNKGLFSGVSLAEGGSNISLLQYADDALFFGKWSRTNAKYLILILKCFGEASGLKVNLSKSRIFGVGVDVEEVAVVASSFNCSHDSLPFAYPGLPVGKNMNFYDAWGDVIDRVCNRLSGWKAKTLSIGGRLTLIKSVLGRESILGNTKDGGLGVGSLRAKNLALLGKWKWRFLVEKDAIWRQVICCFYGGEGGLSSSSTPSGGQRVWSDFIKAISTIEDIDASFKYSFSIKIANGTNTFSGRIFGVRMVTFLFLTVMTMEPEIQRNPENLHANDMLKELKTLFAQQAEQELLQTTRDFHSCKQEEGQSVSSYVLKMKGYIDNLERLGHPVTLGLAVRKTVNELHAMLKLHEQTLPKNNAPALHTIRAESIEKLQYDGLLYSTDLRAFEKCIPCMSGKVARKPYTHQVERAKDLLGLIHTDVCGPFKIMSRQEASYFITFTDDFSSYGYVYLLKYTHEVFETFKVFQKEVENQLGKTIKLLRSDRGGEYMSQEFLDHLKDYGIIAHRTPPYTPQHNGVSERRNRTLLDMGCEALVKRDTLTKPDKLEPRSTRTRHTPDSMCLYIDAEELELGDLGEPANYKAALLDLESEKWLNAINVEMQCMKDNEV
ncbi:retrotransposon protein, putative, ty1-copia subclass [Tanacetum coccineum]